MMHWALDAASLRSTNVTDAGLEHVKGLTNLNYLDGDQHMDHLVSEMIADHHEERPH